MAYKASENDLMAYLYGELEGKEKAMLERYLLENAEARLELDRLREVRLLISQLHDKEVIAPPLFLGDNRARNFYQAPYFKTIMTIAASLLVIMLAARISNFEVVYSKNELRMGFGNLEKKQETVSAQPAATEALLTEEQVQRMINSSLSQSNVAMQLNFAETQKQLDASISKNLAASSAKIDRLVRESSVASQDQIRQFVTGIQAENVALVKNYFQLSASEQKVYIEGLLVDFAKYLQQQRNDDLQVVQTQFKSLEQNTDVFKQETEQILTSIISSVGNKNSLGVIN
ncbi:MAG: hypothetical protein WKF87_18410 [Chryseolinea sp.]